MNSPPEKPKHSDFYSILSLDRSVSVQELHKAVKALKCKYHPTSRLPGAVPSEDNFKNVSILVQGTRKSEDANSQGWTGF